MWVGASLMGLPNSERIVPQSPVHDVHTELGARFTDFGGWEMPVQYSGVIAEHQAVRDSVGVFDVSHLGRFLVDGPGSEELIRRQLCNDIEKAAAGRAQYSMALNHNGGVVDDVIVWRIGEDRFWVMPNGTNFDDILDRFHSDSAKDTTVRPVRLETALIAVQGPGSADVAERVIGSMPGRFRVVEGRYREDWCIAAGTGYTGERGAEIAVPAANGPDLMRDLVDAGAAPCGLGARDTLRLEMGYPLWGQDLDEETTPLEAGLGWVVAWDHEFVGRSALADQKEAGLERSLVALTTEGRAIPRHGYRVRCANSTGSVTSGNFSPTLGHGIALAYLSPSVEVVADCEAEIEIRGTWHPARITSLPFVER